MKKIVSLLLTVVLVLGCVSGLADAADQSPFTVIDEREFDMLGAHVTLWEHVKTGALVMLIANEDTNRAFDITFHTPALNNTGTTHVFEHSTLGGSAKYPSRSLFFNLSTRTYNTYMNASTSAFMTTYPVASLSEEQLLRYADYYLDSCFHPNIYVDEDIFKEEAWRYALDDAEGELTLEGTVYSEMMGAYGIDHAAYYTFAQEMFPGSYFGNVSGGRPDCIPDLTWDDLKAYHSTYYKPGNSLTILYGKFEDVDPFLALIDECFSSFDDSVPTFEEPDYIALTEAKEVHTTFGVTETSDVKDSGIVYYGFLCGNPDADTFNQLDLLTTLINDDSSVFMQRVKQELPNAQAGCYVGLGAPEAYVYFEASGMNEADADTFRTIVDESMAEIAENGFDAESVDAVIAAFSLDILLASEGSDIGVNTAENIAYYWAATGDPFGYPGYIDSIDLYSEYYEAGVFTELVKEYLVGNERTALICTVPEPGLKEQQDAALAEKLAGIKAAMSEEEISAIVADTDALRNNEKEDDSSEYVRALQAVTVETLPEEARVYELTDETGEDGVRRIDVDAGLSGVGEATVMLDASGIPMDKIHYFKLFCDLVGEVPTSAHTTKELASLTTRYLFDGVIRVSLIDDDEAGVAPYLRASFTALDDDLKAGYDLIAELLFDTDFTDVETISKLITNNRSALKRSITQEPYAVELYRAYATTDPTSAYYNYITYLDYYDFLVSAEKLAQEDPETLTANLQFIQNSLKNSYNAVSGYVGSAESAKVNREAADAFLSALPCEETVSQVPDYVFPMAEGNEAFIFDISVQYNMAFATCEQLGLGDDVSAAFDAVNTLVYDMYLKPELREKYGSYGVFNGISDNGMYIISYRDPNVVETFAAYEALPAWIESLEIDQDTLNDYITSAYAYYATPSGELAGGHSALLNCLGDKPVKDAVTSMEELKSLTPESFREYASVYAKLVENGYIATCGSASAITENADLYENVMDPFAAENAVEITFEDTPEDYPYSEAVVFCVKNELLAPASETVFGVDDPATLGDFAAAIHLALLQTPASPEEAVATLAGYGVLPGDPAETELTREDLALYTASLVDTSDYDPEAMSLDAYPDAADVTAGMEPYVGWIFAYEVMLPTEEGLIAPQQTATKGELAYTLYVLLGE